MSSLKHGKQIMPKISRQFFFYLNTFHIHHQISDFIPNPHCFIDITKATIVAEKSHYYPTPCTAFWGEGEGGVIPL
jgi:hypothetical protein